MSRFFPFLSFPQIKYNKILNSLILLFAFFLPISKAGISIVSVLLLLIWLLEGNFKEKFIKIKSNKFIIILFLFFIYNLISITWASDKLFALIYMKKYIYLLLIPIIYTSFDPKNIEKVFSYFLSSMLISVIIAHFTYFGIIEYTKISIFVASPFMAHSNYSVYLAFSLFILAHKFLQSTNLRIKFFLVVCAFLTISNLLINTGRTGQIAFIVTILAFIIFKSKKKFKYFFITVIFSILFFLSAYNLSHTFKKRIDYTLTDVTSMVEERNFRNSFSTRISLWIIASNQFLHNPILGTGIGDELNHSRKFILDQNIENALTARMKLDDQIDGYIDFHSAFFQYAAQLGIIGLSLYILLYINLFILRFKSHLIGNLNFYFISLVLCFSFIGVNLRYRFSLIFFIFFAAIFLNLSKNKELSNE